MNANEHHEAKFRLQKQVDEQEQRTQIMREAAEVQRRMQAETERSIAAEREAALAENQRRWRERNKQWMEDKAMLAVCILFPVLCTAPDITCKRTSA